MEQRNKIIKIALADDHVMLRHSLAMLINGFKDYIVILEAANGRELITQLKAGDLPDVILLDLNMPDMDGLETAAWLSDNYPSVHILILSMYNSDQALIRLLQYGVKGFLKKDMEPSELDFAIRSHIQSGFYYSQNISGKMAYLFRNSNSNTMALERAMLTPQEIFF